MHFLMQWFHCFLLFIRLSLFKASPSDLPYSPACLGITVLVYVFAGEILLGEQRGLGLIILQIMVEILILGAISYIVLNFKQHTERFLQTLTALIGISLVISLVSIPIMLALPDAMVGNEVNPVTLQASLALLLWNLAVISLIFKRSFEISTLAAGFIAFNYFLIYELLLLNFF